MKNKTTYEMEDIMGLITRDLAEKGLAPDPGSVTVRTREVAGSDFPVEIEIDVNVSWVGVIVPVSPLLAAHAAVPDLGRREPENHPLVLPRGLLDEAPEPGVGPAIEIGNVTAASQQLARTTPGPFSPDKVKRRLTGLDGESAEYPGPPRTGGR